MVERMKQPLVPRKTVALRRLARVEVSRGNMTGRGDGDVSDRAARIFREPRGAE
jgi:hypothetical protein